MQTKHEVEPDLVLKRIKIKKARNRLLDFIKYTNKKYKANFHHQIICDDLDDFLRSETRNRLMIFTGPRKGKSQIVSRALPAYVFGRTPENNIIGASYSSDLASKNCKDVQEIMDSDEYADVFPNTHLPSKKTKRLAQFKEGSIRYVRNSEEFQLVGKDLGEYKAAGVGGALTGFGCDILLIDDVIKNMEEALSPNRKKVVYDWYTSTAYTRLSKKGKVVIIMTRWAEDDLCGALLADAKKNPEADQWEVLCFPEMFEEDHEFKHADDPRKEGEVLWPEFFPEEKVIKTKNSVGSKIWASLYQQKPAPTEGSVLKASDFKYFDATPKFDYLAMSIDAAFKDTDGSDNVAMGVFGVRGANKYLLHLVREKLDFVATIKALLKVRAMFQTMRFILIEDKANGPAVVSTLKSSVAGIITYSPTESKLARAYAITPQLEAGNVFLPNKYYEPNRQLYPWIMDEKVFDAFLNEVKMFPFGKNDDCVDMLTQFLIKLNSIPNWLTEMGDSEELPMDITNDGISELAQIMGWNIR